MLKTTNVVQSSTRILNFLSVPGAIVKPIYTTHYSSHAVQRVPTFRYTYTTTNFKMPPIPPKGVKVAVLDDYAGTSKTYFETLEPGFKFEWFSDTLPPYNHPDTTDDVKKQIVNRLKPFTIVSSMRERTPFPRELLQQLPGLKLLLTTATRNLGIDMVAAKELGITVTGTTNKRPPNAQAITPTKRKGPDSTTQHTVALILGIAKNLARDNDAVKRGEWQLGLSTGLTGKTLGLLGLGRLGIAVGKIMYSAFGMKIIAWSSNLTQETADEKATNAGLPIEDEDGDKTFRLVSKEELFKNADVLSVHYVLSDRSRGIVGAEDLKLMKRSALFINTSRGPLVDEDALLQCLSNGAIKGAALDVFALEPLPLDSKWRTTNWGQDGTSQVLLTPHTGYVEEETLNNWYYEQSEILRSWRDGKGVEPVIN
ncbi:NAD(P)-binding Rossmann-fold containing protein [Glarea lozoyensis ATCC 20868]|uniref:NAD(P)-binding Rossmann-fold containing protein n=1 Tax=Glarea lozoyensis (strain ATCC 20868 / MF5171) TaxID=1116229 RepID=S3D6J1_GLAL2|nr:NAD(P)-binding Rossmann-fold containing protein [Glarea lozoyensis ATCC 20868]EPE33360.1 NAD(P)-binding Rossmann-fold containing protein [Glarea lozoyensis ATCC 20868]